MQDKTAGAGVRGSFGEKYSDRVPAERLAARVGRKYPDALVDMVLDALDEVIDVGTPEQRVERQRRFNVGRTEDGGRIRRSRSSPGKVYAQKAVFRTSLLMAVLGIARDESGDLRARRVALVGAAMLLLVSVSSRVRYGGEVVSVACGDVVFDDLVPFVSWAASGEPIPDQDTKARHALVRARGDTAQNADGTGTKASDGEIRRPERPTSGNEQKLLRVLERAPLGKYVAASSTGIANASDAKGRLVKRGYVIDVAKRGEGKGYRLAARHHPETRTDQGDPSA